jgi:hypothetical protein
VCCCPRLPRSTRLKIVVSAVQFCPSAPSLPWQTRKFRCSGKPCDLARRAAPHQGEERRGGEVLGAGPRPGGLLRTVACGNRSLGSWQAHLPGLVSAAACACGHVAGRRVVMAVGVRLTCATVGLVIMAARASRFGATCVQSAQRAPRNRPIDPINSSPLEFCPRRGLPGSSLPGTARRGIPATRSGSCIHRRPNSNR